MTFVPGSIFLDLGCNMFIYKSARSAKLICILRSAQLENKIQVVNAKTHGSEVIIQIMYPHTDPMLIPSVNGAYNACLTN